jgi:hypothetical protein
VVEVGFIFEENRLSIVFDASLFVLSFDFFAS